MVMKAAVYEGEQTLTLKESCLRPPEKGEVQINVAYCGICGSDLHVLQGAEDHRMKIPSVIGHECSGVVGQVGERVSEFKPGDRVVVWPVKSCQNCVACKSGFQHVCQNLRVRGIETEGAFQTSWTLEADALVKIPEKVSLRHAALAEPLAICCHVVKQGPVKLGDYAVVIGGGPIGLLTALVARSEGARVLISEVNPGRVKKAQELGFITVNPKEEDVRKVVKEATRGVGADVVFETSGSQAGVDIMVHLPRVHGTVVLVAIYGKPMVVDLKDA